jgi:tetratricopeptide (TPR) repeat protein
VTLKDDLARTEVTQSFFNPSDAVVEGWYWFTIPEGAAVTRFALMVDGQLVDGTVIERKEAAARYEAAVQRAWDPALLEWVDGLTFRARIYPVPPMGERTVVLAYTELLPRFRGTTRYLYPMGDENSPTIQEFSLSVDVGSSPDLEIATVAGARVEGSGAARRVTMRRSGFSPSGDFLLEIRDPRPRDPVRVLRYRSGRPEADYVMLRYAPEENWDAVPVPEGVVVVVVDTSVGGDDGDRKLKLDAAEAILRALSSGDRFALLAADLQPRRVWPLEPGLAQATEAEISKAMEALSDLPAGGALDLGEVFNEALKLVHGATQPAFVYIGDGLPTVGEMRGSEIVERLKRSLSGSRARLFTMAVGMHANTSLLNRLASVGGGQALRVDLPEQTVQRAIEIVGAVKTPTITDLKIDLGVGLDQVFASGSGKVTRGQEILIYGRTHHPLPGTVRITGNLVGRPFMRDYRVDASSGERNAYAASLWAMEKLRFLLGSGAEENRGAIVALGVEYQLMTPYTSFLTLENAPEPAVVAEERQRGAAVRPASRELAAASEADDERVSYKSKASEAPMAAAPAPRPAPPPSQPVATSTTGASASYFDSSAPTGGATAGSSAMTTRLSRPRADAVPARPVVDLETGAGVLLPARSTGSDWLSTPTSPCSDASRRSLAVRRDLWARRLAVTSAIGDAARLYENALVTCELDGWRAERTLLDLILGRARSPSDIALVLAAFEPRPKAQEYLRTGLLKRVVAPEGLLPTGIHWAAVDAVLNSVADPERRLVDLRKVISFKPGDPEGLRRLLLLLTELGRDAEALNVAARLRAGGFASPNILVTLGDLQAGQGQAETARKTYSEIVEYNPWDAQARRMLGDIFLRHGWHEDAYRQYATLLQLDEGDPAAIIRFARSAAGSGRTDEALRTFRKVLELSLEPSTSDPREWARLWSASTLSRLMVDARQDPEKYKALERALKRAELFRGPGTLVLLSWSDLDADLTLRFDRGGRAMPLDLVEAGGTGLVAAWVPSELGETSPVVEWGRRRPARGVAYEVQFLAWDGRDFKAPSPASSAFLQPPPRGR